MKALLPSLLVTLTLLVGAPVDATTVLRVDLKTHLKQSTAVVEARAEGVMDSAERDLIFDVALVF